MDIPKRERQQRQSHSGSGSDDHLHSPLSSSPLAASGENHPTSAASGSGSMLHSSEASLRRRSKSPTPVVDSVPIADPFERIRSAPKELLVSRSSSPRRSPTPSRSTPKGEVIFDSLPRLSDVNQSLWDKILEQKMLQCCVLFEFEPSGNDDDAESSPFGSTEAITAGNSKNSSSASLNKISPVELRNREIKRDNLTELIECVTSRVKPIPESLYPIFFKMIFANIFRPIPPPINPIGDAFDPAEDEPVLDPSWPHLQLVYELFIRFLESAEMNSALARKFIDQPFILQLLGLFDLEDPRERDFLKTTLHRVYAKFLNLRAFIRRSIHNVFYELASDPTSRHNIAEMLEILGSIINGFALPLKDEHKLFLEKTLLPLHKTRYLTLYFRQLNYCIVQFVEKDPSLTSMIIHGLLKLWPKTNSVKEVMFLNEIEEILDVVPPGEFGRVCGPLFSVLARSIASSHFQVAERALLLWNNDYIVGLMSQFNEQILPLVLPVLTRLSKSHWNRNVHNLALNALETFMEIDSGFFECSVADLALQRRRETARSQGRMQLWRELEAMALSNCAGSEQRARLVRSQTMFPVEDEKRVPAVNVSMMTETGGDLDIQQRTDDAHKMMTMMMEVDEPERPPSPSLSIRRKSALPLDEEVYEELSRFDTNERPRSPKTTSESELESDGSGDEANDNRDPQMEDGHGKDDQMEGRKKR